MNRKDMLEKLHSISEPFTAITVFSDGMICDYMTSKGCGEFEFGSWDDLGSYCFDDPDQLWEEMSDDLLYAWLERFEYEDFRPIAEVTSDEEIAEEDDTE